MGEDGGGHLAGLGNRRAAGGPVVLLEVMDEAPDGALADGQAAFDEFFVKAVGAGAALAETGDQVSSVVVEDAASAGRAADQLFRGARA
ncbi:hypothetical protein [Streptomyces sp. NPDC058664]|uniref:hypothetical protein n=1 Tax=unclassified Streptomyces TaxID=2593676 RepID=UPI003668314C